jgi:hypothetical protein
MRRHRGYQLAAFAYFALATVLALTVLLAPFLADQSVATGFYVLGTGMAALPLWLGVWSLRVFRGTLAPTFKLFYLGLLPIAFIGPFTKGFLFSFAFGLPFLFLVIAYRSPSNAPASVQENDG